MTPEMVRKPPETPLPAPAWLPYNEMTDAIRRHAEEWPVLLGWRQPDESFDIVVATYAAGKWFDYTMMYFNATDDCETRFRRAPDNFCMVPAL